VDARRARAYSPAMSLIPPASGNGEPSLPVPAGTPPEPRPLREELPLREERAPHEEPAPPEELPAVTVGFPAEPVPEAIDARFVVVRPPGAPRWPAETGLAYWLGLIAIFGVGGVVLGQQELALLVAMAGLFVAAQAADLDPRWAGLYRALTWIVPVAGAGAFAALAMLIAESEMTGASKWGLLAYSGASAVACLATGIRPVADALARALLKADPPSHILRLAARLIVAGILVAVPGWFALRDMLTGDSQNLMEQLPLGGGLIGYVLLALAAVGFLVRRDLRATLDRLGIAPLTPRHAGTVILGVVGLLLLNYGADLLERRALPDLWRQDQDFNEALAGGLTTVEAVMLGVSAGVGEEITMRGALQPRLGLKLTSLLFASLHVQYSWFGMAVILALGLILGVIRQRTNTTAAIAIHVLYDIVAVLAT
jgi:CAAX prenyl protease-like protein